MKNPIILKLIEEHHSPHEGWGAGEGDTINITYECPCGKGIVYYEKEDTPGFRESFTNTDCQDCQEKYEFKGGSAIEKLRIITSQELKQELIDSGFLTSIGHISMTMNGTTVSIKGTDTVGNSIQEWLAQWLKDNNIYFRSPVNTQNFPDFYLSADNTKSMVEVKSYVASRSPAFDVANFDSYWKTVQTDSYMLDCDYLIFAYNFDNGILSIKDIFLKKVWEITCPANEYALKCQRKNGQIYNIRPATFNSKSSKLKPFSSKEKFLAALYKTVLGHTNKAGESKIWLKNVISNYKNFSRIDMTEDIKKYL